MEAFHLALHLGGSAAWSTLEEVQQAIDAGDTPDVTAEGTTISIVHGGAEHFAARRSMGSLPRLVAQLEPLSQRLGAGDDGLLRSAVEDVPEVLFVVFEPDGDEVEVRGLVIDELPYTDWYPDGPHGDDLVTWVTVNGQPTWLGRPEPLRAGRAWLVDALRHEAAAGQAVCSALGWVDHLPAQA